MLSLSFVTGTQPGKWFERFRERTHHGGLNTVDSDDALGELLQGRVRLALTRLPDSRIDDTLHVVELYEEEPGIAFPKDSYLAAETGTVLASDYADEIVNWSIPESGEVDPAAVRDALQIVAANVGVVIAPRPLLKVLSKKLVEHRGLREGVSTKIALVWRRDDDDDSIQDFVGIAKGRTANSSRTATPRRSAREKTLAKQARRQQQGSKHSGSPKQPKKPSRRRPSR